MLSVPAYATDWDWVDAPLTERGLNEARANQEAARALLPQPCVLIASPLQRAMETGLLSFAHAVTGPDGIPVLAHEGCRERRHDLCRQDYKHGK